MSSSSSSQAVAAAGGVATDRQTAAKEKEKGGREGNEWRLDLTDKIAGPFLFLMGGFMYNRLVSKGLFSRPVRVLFCTGQIGWHFSPRGIPVGTSTYKRR